MITAEKPDKFARLRKTLEDALVAGLNAYNEAGGYQGVGVEFHGYFNIMLLNSGIENLFLTPIDLDPGHSVTPDGEAICTLTAVFVYDPPHKAEGRHLIVRLRLREED